MKSGILSLLLLVFFALTFGAPDAYATNGMNLEGYGPIAHGMGGASFGYWNGTAAMMGNPATLPFLMKTTGWTSRSGISVPTSTRR